MRRLISLCVLLSLVMLVVAPGALASSQVADVIYEKTPIQDLEVLFDRAINGVTDLDSESHGLKSHAVLEDKITGAKKNIEVFKTTEVIKVQKYKNGSTKKSYATTAFAIVPFENDTVGFKKPLELLAYTGDLRLLAFTSDFDKGGSNWDPTGGVRAYSRIYWDEYNIGGSTFVGLVGAEGNWQNYDYPQTLVLDKTVLLGQEGWKSDTHYFNGEIEYSPPGSSFSYPAPSSWNTQENAVKESFYDIVGCLTTAEIDYVGGGDTILTLSNTI